MVYLVCDEDPTGVYGSIINGILEADQTESTVLGENYVIGGLFLDLTPIKDTSDDGIKGLSGFVVISSEYHAQIGIGKNLIIVNAHDFNLNGDCVYCGYHTDVEDEDVVEIIDPTEPSTEEEEDETVEVTPDEEPEEDENPKTGLALALVPMMIAAAVAVITKK